MGFYLHLLRRCLYVVESAVRTAGQKEALAATISIRANTGFAASAEQGKLDVVTHRPSLHETDFLFLMRSLLNLKNAPDRGASG